MKSWILRLLGLRRPKYPDPEISRLMESVEWPHVDVSPAAYAQDRAEIAANRLWMASMMEFAEARAEGL